jgi:perosamine synthetase
MIPIAKPIISDEEVDEVVKVLRSGFIAQGPKVAEFEEKFCRIRRSETCGSIKFRNDCIYILALTCGRHWSWR